jgi:N-acetylglucosamine malate deacetylase 1
MIAAGRRVLVLAPHTDDGEFGCGGTIARLCEAGALVHYHAFSSASRSLPPGFPEDTLIHEAHRATATLGIPPERVTVHDFDVRTFPLVRQEILEILVALNAELDPEIVLMPSLGDIHQDHETIGKEGLRAFKRTTVLGYEIPWNCFSFSQQAYVSLEPHHLDRKVEALACYASQQHRNYANEEYIRNLARTHGIVSGRELAEVFEVYRWIL